jgi:signal transduction histidine kinase
MRSLTVKLLLAFIVVGLTGTALVAMLAGIATVGEFGQFMFKQRSESLADDLAAYYLETGGWEGLPEAFPLGNFRAFRGRREGLSPHVPYLLADQSNQIVVPSGAYQVGEPLPASLLEGGVPIEVEGQEVGRLVMEPGAFGVDPAENQFIDRMLLTLGLGAVGGTAVAVILGILLARSLSRPLRELTAAARQIESGDLDTEVPVRSSDELGQLAKAFNQMNANLARARDLRQQMTADIAHELRTPISIILGHAEAMGEGVLPSTAETIEVIREEAGRLERLVNDLRTLSLVEAGELALELERTTPEKLLQTASAAYRTLAEEKRVSIELVVSDQLPALDVDTDRMNQVLGNLLSNALRYTPEGGSIRLEASPHSEGLQIRVIDAGPGIDSEDLPFVFDRFYRADKSRHREGTGSGLGLAIAKSIVEAHGGSIRAESPAGDGAAVVLELPLPE